MNNIAAYQEDFKIDEMSTDDALKILAMHGEPRCVKMNRGWHASIEVFVTGKGVSFEVQTNFKMPSPNEAVRECLRLLISAIKEIKESK